MSIKGTFIKAALAVCAFTAATIGGKAMLNQAQGRSADAKTAVAILNANDPASAKAQITKLEHGDELMGMCFRYDRNKETVTYENDAEVHKFPFKKQEALACLQARVSSQPMSEPEQWGLSLALATFAAFTAVLLGTSVRRDMNLKRIDFTSTPSGPQ